jgi:plastocyanin
MDTPDTATVEITEGHFVPQLVVVPRSTDVLWVNLDDVPHSVRQEARVLLENTQNYQTACGAPTLPTCDSKIDSQGNIAPGKSHKHPFGDLDGVWTYGSDASPTDAQMKGAVIVAPVDR